MNDTKNLESTYYKLKKRMKELQNEKKAKTYTKNE